MRILLFSLLLLASSVTFSQQWRDVGGGVNGIIYTLKNDTISGRLYVGGEFTLAGGTQSDKVAYWDGINWSSIGFGNLFHGFSVYVGSITIFNGDLIVGGHFDSINNIRVNNIARWDGISWNALGQGFEETGAYVSALEVYNGELYAAGNFHFSGNDTVSNIAKWNGSFWEGLKNGLDDYVTSMHVFENKLIIGGVFSGPLIDSLTQASPAIVAWNGVNWGDFGLQYFDMPSDFTIHNDTLYASGSASVKFYNGTYWTDIAHPSGGATPWIMGIESFLNSIFVCGYFQSPPDIGRYNGIDYDSLANALGFVNELEVFNGELYVGGGFSHINGLMRSNISRYNPYNKIEFKLSNKLIIYPNPTSEKLYLSEVGSILSFGNYSIHIVSASGSKVAKYSRCFIPYEIDLNSFKPGIYSLIILTEEENEKYVYPFIKK